MLQGDCGQLCPRCGWSRRASRCAWEGHEVRNTCTLRMPASASASASGGTVPSPPSPARFMAPSCCQKCSRCCRWPRLPGARATQYATLDLVLPLPPIALVLIPRPPPTRFLWVLFNSAAASLASRPRAGQPSRTPCARRCARATARNSRHAPPVWARRPPTPKGQVGWFVHKGPFAPFWNCACVL